MRELKETAEIFDFGGFLLRKWVANHKDVLADLSGENLAMEPFALRDVSSSTSILGLFCYIQ